MPNTIKEFDREELGSSNETVTRLNRSSVLRGTSMYLKGAFKDFLWLRAVSNLDGSQNVWLQNVKPNYSLLGRNPREGIGGMGKCHEVPFLESCK